MMSRFYLFTVVCLLLAVNLVNAAPFAEVGDARLRHDVQLLSDYGIIKAPVSAWPIAWNSLSTNIASASINGKTPKSVINSLRRVQKRIRKESRKGRFNSSIRIATTSFNENIPKLRNFSSTSREDDEISAGLDWMGKSIAFKLKVTNVSNPDDDKSTRLDGSYLGWASNGWSYSLGSFERWWGPGYEGSLILSNNARPVPAFSIQRTHAKPFKTKWLSWLGPWQFQFFAGQLESDRFVPNAKLFGARFNFKPTQNLEIGLSRTAQWGGDGRPETFDSFIDMLLGKDNHAEESFSGEDQPGNQLAGFDLRWKPANEFPLSIYMQRIGEDQAGIYPTANMYLLGMENWGDIFDSDYRLHIEFSDTHSYRGSSKGYNTSYEHSIYQDGYRYFDRSMGHSMDNDSVMLSFGLNIYQRNGNVWGLLIRDAEFNTDGTNSIDSPNRTAGINTVSASATEYTDIILSREQPFLGGHLKVELAKIRFKDLQLNTSINDTQFGIEWSHRF